MKENKLDEIIGGKLREFREEPSPTLFGRIEESLASQRTAVPKRRGLLYRIAAIGSAAAVLFGLILGGYSLFRTAEQLPDVTDSHITAPVPNGSPDNSAQTILPADGRAKKQARSNNGKEDVLISEIIRKAIEEDPRVKQAETLASDPSASGGIETNADREAAKETNAHTKAPSPAHDNDTGRAVRPDNDLYTPEYWNRLFAQEKKTRRDRRLVASAYGGNFGAVNGDYKTNDITALAANNMKLSNTSGMDIPDGDTGYYSSQVQLSSIPALSGANVPELTHKMPFNFGLTLSYPVTQKLSLVAGLNYSELVSTGSLEKTEFRQEVYYIGVPLGAAFTVYSKGRLNLYIYGGGMIEKAVSARLTAETAYDSGKSKEVLEKYKAKGVQISVRAAAGMSFSIARGFDIYVEPGVAYYFEKVDPFKTYRTEYPTSFSITAGIRFGL